MRAASTRRWRVLMQCMRAGMTWMFASKLDGSHSMHVTQLKTHMDPWSKTKLLHGAGLGSFLYALDCET